MGTGQHTFLSFCGFRHTAKLSEGVSLEHSASRVDIPLHDSGEGSNHETPVSTEDGMFGEVSVLMETKLLLRRL